MSIFTKLLEDRIRIRVKPNSNAEDGIQNIRNGETLIDKLADTLESGSTINLSELDGFRRLSNERDIQYRVYDEMREDSIISAALEMYADDATQYNRDGSIIWVDSDKSEIAAFGNRLIDNLNLNRDAWQHIYTLCLYGDLYLETFRDDPKEDTDERITKMGSNNLYINPKGYILEEYVEAYDNPCELYDILEKGKTAGYIRVPMDKDNDNEIGTMIYKDLELETKQTVYKPDKFIHISLFDGINRYPEKITIQTDNQSSYTYKVKRGKSILHDIYKIYQELKLMEDSLLLNRVTRSSIIRILQVEVGDSTKSQISNILKRLKQMIEQRNMLDKDKGTFKSQASPGPVDNVIYVPTRNGKGAVSASNIGGDVDVRSIVDLDYFKNKLYGGLKIPKQFLGDDMEGCLRGNTELLLLCGQRRTIKYLYEHKDEYIGKGIMSCNEDGTLVPTIITNIALTRKNAKYIRVHIDNNTYVDATPDHLFMMRDGSFKEAQDLIPGDSLMPHYDNVKNGRRYVLDNKTESWTPQYRLVAKQKYGELKKGYQIHHKNRIKIDDDFDNLYQLTFEEHYKEHEDELHKKANISRQELKNSNPEKYYEIYGKGGRHNKGVKKSKHIRESLSRKLKGRPSNNQFTTENNPMNNIETRIKVGISIKKKFEDEEYYNENLNILKNARDKSVESRKLRKQLKIRKVRCFKCGKIFDKWMNDEQYEEYLNGNQLVYCSKDHLYKYPNATKISCTRKLLDIANYDIDLYNELRDSEKYGRKDKYLKEDGAILVMSYFEEYTPEIINHKVLDIEWLDDIEDAYDIEVENESHSFVLGCGIFVHNSGLSAGTSLTKLDARYARTIKRIQNAYIQGITTLINIFALDKNLDEYVNNFTVKMVSPSTMEDQERDEQMGSRMDLIGTFIDLLGERYTDETIKEVFEYFVDYYLSDNELSEILKKDPGIIEDEIQDEDMEDNSSDFDGGFEGTEDFGSGFEDDLSDDEFDIDEESGEDIGFEDEESSEENSEEFGDFESDF